MGEWRDIASAPRDTAVWLWFEGEAYIGYCQPKTPWSRSDTWFLKASVRRRAGGTDEIVGHYIHDVEPSLWQPLPSPPET